MSVCVCVNLCDSCGMVYVVELHFQVQFGVCQFNFSEFLFPFSASDSEHIDLRRLYSLYFG